MDTLHTVLRSIRGDAAGEAKGKATPGSQHLTVFREFLAHLEKINRPIPRPQSRGQARVRSPSTKTRRKAKP